MADWLAPIDNYCERTDASFLSEPLNAITNIAFIIAAVFLWREYQKKGLKDLALLFLIAMVGIVGVGSFGFHTYANRLTMMGDVLPIVILVLSYIAVGYRRLAGFTLMPLLSVYGGFFIAAFLLGRVPEAYAFNGSIAYFPCLMVLAVLAFLCRKGSGESSKLLTQSVVLFTVSLTFRSVDMAWCNTLPIGTHFIWHSLNGLLLYWLVRSVMTIASTPSGHRL